MVHFILSGTAISKSKNITDPPVLSFRGLILISRHDVFAAHHFDHLVITYVSPFYLLEAEFLACFEVVVALDLLGCQCLTFSTVCIRVDILVQLDVCSLAKLYLQFLVVDCGLKVIISCKVFLFAHSWINYSCWRDMCFLFMIYRFSMLCFLDEILDPWSMHTFLIFFVCFDRWWSCSISLH